MRAIAPLPQDSARRVAPIIVAGAFRTASGLGESARLCHAALASAGLPVYGIDLTTELLQPVDHLLPLMSDGAFIPADPQNRDYEAFLAWQAQGNAPEPTSGAPEWPEFTRLQLRLALLSVGKSAQQVEVEFSAIPDPIERERAMIYRQDTQLTRASVRWSARSGRRSG